MKWIAAVFCILTWFTNPLWAQLQTSAMPFYEWSTFSMGADLSYVNQIEDNGGIYRDSSFRKDPFLIFASHGANTVRVRLWHSPQWTADLNAGHSYSDILDVEKTIRRAKNAGMAVNLDIHYSDEWADPQHQNTPEAWAKLDLNTLADSVYNYTYSVLNYLKAKNLTPEMVQVGNETNTGMLWPIGKVENENWLPFAKLLNSGIKAVRDFSSTSAIKPRIIMHVAQFQTADWWLAGIMLKGGVTDFDIVGVSHYQKWSDLKTLPETGKAIKNLKEKYHKDVMIVEVAYPWTDQNIDTYHNIIGAADSISGYPATADGQFRYMKDLTDQVFKAGGSGIMYWEPAWITSDMNDKWGKGSAWENCSFFDFNNNALPVFRFMSLAY